MYRSTCNCALTRPAMGLADIQTDLLVAGSVVALPARARERSAPRLLAVCAHALCSAKGSKRIPNVSLCFPAFLNLSQLSQRAPTVSNASRHFETFPTARQGRDCKTTWGPPRVQLARPKGSSASKPAVAARAAAVTRADSGAACKLPRAACGKKTLAPRMRVTTYTPHLISIPS